MSYASCVSELGDVIDMLQMNQIIMEASSTLGTRPGHLHTGGLTIDRCSFRGMLYY